MEDTKDLSDFEENNQESNIELIDEIIEPVIIPIVHYYSKSTQSFYVSDINVEIPTDAIEITIEQHEELLTAINKGCIIFNDLTYSAPPPSEFHEYKNGKWVLNKTQQQGAVIEKNRALKNQLLNEAVNEISLLQDAIDLDMQEDGDEERLKEWKKYRILLSRVDLTIDSVALPDKP